MLSTLLLLQAINTERSYYHESPLKPAHVLQVAAQAKVEDEAKYHYFAHVSPQGDNIWEFIWSVETNDLFHLRINPRYAKYVDEDEKENFTIVGENLSKGYDDVPSLVQAWMNSPTHRKNLLEPYWKETGFGIVQEGKTILVSEDFGD